MITAKSPFIVDILRTVSLSINVRQAQIEAISERLSQTMSNDQSSLM